MEHKKGKVAISNSVMLVSEDGEIVTNNLPSPLEGLSPDIMEIVANTERIATLWNSMEGLTDEEVENLIPLFKEIAGHFSNPAYSVGRILSRIKGKESG